MRALSCMSSLLLALSLSGCKLEPSYHRSPPPLASQALVATADAADYPSLQSWWQQFDDPELLELLSQAQQNNPDLQIAIDHVMAAHDMIIAARSRRYPSLAFSGLPTDPVTTQLRQANSARVDVDSNIFEISLDASYEFDFWGRIRNEIRGANAKYRASIADAGTVQIGLYSSIARTYFDLRALDESITIETQRRALAEQHLQLLRLRLHAGRSAAAPLDDAQLALEEHDAHLAELQRARALDVSTLAALLAVSDGSLQIAAADLRERVSLQPPPQGLPASLLDRRPDVVAAEEQLKSAHADIAIAHAELLPQLALTGKFGFVTGAVRNLAHAGSTVLGVGPEIAFPIFDAGMRRSQLDASRWQRDASYNEYRKTVFTALGDVERSLLSYQAAVEAAQRYAGDHQLWATRIERINLAMSAGHANRIDYIAVQDRLLESELLSVQAYRDQLNGLVGLYQALGGGWNDKAVTLPEHLPDRDAPTAASTTG